jgi:hypothetical protein
MWNVHMLAELNTKMSLVTDLRSGQQLFVTWSQIGVVRLACAVDADLRNSGEDRG